MSRGLVPMAATVLLALVLIHAGTTIPDTDQWLPLLGHRSAVTHSMLLPALVMLRWSMVGGMLAGGFAIHLAADLLSRKWIGYALVKLPIVGSLGATGSQVFLGANVLLGLWLYHRAAVASGLPRVCWGTFAVAGAAYLLVNERWWLVLVPVVLFMTLVLARRSR